MKTENSTAYLPDKTQAKGVLYHEMSRLWKKRLAYSCQESKSRSGVTNLCDRALPCLH